jgi:hypothetical protein
LTKPRAQKELLALIALSLSEGLSHFGLIYPDSSGYLANAGFFQGIEEPNQFRLLRPVIPLLASYVGRLTDLQTAFAIINLFFWCAACVLMFWFADKFTRRSDISILAAGFFAVAYPMLVYGDAVLTDMAGFFFVLLGLHLILNWDILRSTYVKVLASAGLMAIGILCRETVACVFVVALLWALISKASPTKLILFVAIPFAALFAWAGVERLSLLGFALAQVSYSAKFQPISWPDRILTWFYTIRVSFRPDMLLLAAVGLVESVRDRSFMKYLAILAGISTFLLAVPGPVDYRFTFLLFPAVLPLGAIGTLQVSSFVSHRLPISAGHLRRTTILFTLIVFLAYSIETNWLALRFVSFP